MAKYRKNEVEATHPTRPHGKCKVWGCPLKGVLSNSITGGSEYFCRYHFAADSDDWVNITMRIKNRRAEIEGYDLLFRASPQNTDLHKRRKNLWLSIRQNIDTVKQKNKTELAHPIPSSGSVIANGIDYESGEK